MFALVGYSGFKIIEGADGGRRAWGIACTAIVIGLLGMQVAAQVEGLPAMVSMLLGFPVSTSTVAAIVLELLWPRSLESEVSDVR